MDGRALSGESNHHDARLNGRGQKVAENTKHSKTIESFAIMRDEGTLKAQSSSSHYGESLDTNARWLSSILRSLLLRYSELIHNNAGPRGSQTKTILLAL